MTEDALRQHYLRVADESPVPVVLYNIPKYMHFALSGPLVQELARHGNVIGINGHLAKDDAKLPRNPSVDAVSATARAAAQAGIANFHALGGSSLTYVINEKGNAFLAWMTRVEYV
ncbi:MAG: dihydrodipicolinate synthase family protein, partial [Thermoplasmatota archaeon]